MEYKEILEKLRNKLKEKITFLWLDGVFNEETIERFSSHSPATNKWQEEFSSSLQGFGHEVFHIGYVVERVWPFGKLKVRVEDAKLKSRVKGNVIGYLNIPVFRCFDRFIRLFFQSALYIKRAKQRPDFIVVFSCLERGWVGSSNIWSARCASFFYKIPWICIIGDGETPRGAAGYVFCP